VQLGDRGVAIRAAQGGEEGVVGDGHDGEHDGWRRARRSSYLGGKESLRAAAKGS
jgi:hypothetical protein